MNIDLWVWRDTLRHWSRKLIPATGGMNLPLRRELMKANESQWACARGGELTNHLRMTTMWVSWKPRPCLTWRLMTMSRSMVVWPQLCQQKLRVGFQANNTAWYVYMTFFEGHPQKTWMITLCDSMSVWVLFENDKSGALPQRLSSLRATAARWTQLDMRESRCTIATAEFAWKIMPLCG